MALLLLAPAAVVGADAGGEGSGRSNGLYTEPGLEYVAIAPTHLARYLAPLVEWKMDRGVPAQVFNYEQILANYGGRDDAERVHNFLQDLYHNHTGGTPQWLLLAGDSDQLPVRYLWANRDHSGKTQAARNLYVGDTYFSGLDSDWDTDGDDVFGEPGEEDLMPELFVGRIAASLPEEVEAAVAKVLSYELDPPTGDWYDNVFLGGALMDEPNRVDDPYTLPSTSGYSDEGFGPYMDNAYEITQKIRGIMGEDRDIIELVDYPFFEGCRYTAANDTLNRAASAAAWERGNAFVFWASHGYEAFGGLAEYEGTGLSGMFESARPFIVWEDTIVNTTGGMLPLVYISSCYAGQFDKGDTTNFEQMITVPEGGAIALIAGDGDTFRLENISTESFGNWWLSERFWQLVIEEGMVRPGEALYTLKHEYHTYYLTEGPPAGDWINMDYFYSNLYAYNLQGDPEVPVWVGTPSRLDLTIEGGAVFNAPSMRFRVTDRDTGEPVEGATVHARGAGLNGMLEAITDADGRASFPKGPRMLGEELRLAVTKDNWVPDRHIITVGEGIRDLRLTDADLVGPSVEPYKGQTVTFEASVSNTGDFPLSDVTVHFDSGDLKAPENGGVSARNQTRVVDIGAGDTLVMSFSHRYTGPGEYDVMARVDPEDRYAEASELDNDAIRHLSLSPLPTLPENAGPVAVVVGQVFPFPIDLEGYVQEEEGAPEDVTFELGTVTDGVSAWIDSENQLHILVTHAPDNDPFIDVVMWAGGEEADTMTVLLEVQQVNLPPIVRPVPDMDLAVGEDLSWFINATNPEGGNLFLSTSLPGATFEGQDLVWTAGADDVGVHYPTVTATDLLGASTQVRFMLTVDQRNSLPSIELAEDAFTVEEGEVVHVPVSAVDSDDDPLSFHLAAPDDGFSIDSGTGMVTFDATGKDPGVYTATVVVTDGMGSAQRDLEVTVEGTTDPPVPWLLLGGVLMLVVVAVVFGFRK
ncbi:MAG: hypothetical protein JSW25_00175 [Thermoplasmata archaeon]|nr:MAG: hypothetical protein JSW25_00175 [Thermoplasmata archaeon]